MLPYRLSPRTGRARRGFSLVEVLMVIVVLAIMAGVVIPQVSGTVGDAKRSAALANLNVLTNAIERYRIDHNGAAPDLVTARRLPQLTSRTNAAGDVGTGAEHIYGPYLAELPENPLSDSQNVYTVVTVPPASLDLRVGWVYHVETGQVWAGLHAGVDGG
ncbi:MAG: type II secretion system GspH family protein [Pirellulaceae bacterium]|nr:type II secretion system GspH family protein [Pirellulaceae bacterium]